MIGKNVCNQHEIDVEKYNIYKYYSEKFNFTKFEIQFQKYAASKTIFRLQFSGSIT